MTTVSFLNVAGVMPLLGWTPSVPPIAPSLIAIFGGVFAEPVLPTPAPLMPPSLSSEFFMHCSIPSKRGKISGAVLGVCLFLDFVVKNLPTMFSCRPC